jgi:hypothetical protein
MCVDCFSFDVQFNDLMKNILQGKKSMGNDRCSFCNQVRYVIYPCGFAHSASHKLLVVLGKLLYSLTVVHNVESVDCCIGAVFFFISLAVRS